jgi:pimeloyl-ACP methyl ester carboxylesterase
MAIKTINYQDKIFNLSYDILNPNQTKVLVILHGWGSNKNIMKQAFNKYGKEFKHIYIDMPGFGQSDNNYILNTSDYANIIKLFLEKLNITNDQNLFIMGHSFGGKVATLLEPSNLVLLSSAGIVEEKSTIVKLKIQLNKILKFLKIKSLSKFLRSNDVQNYSENMYETFKNVLNEDFTDHFTNFKGKAYIFWGEDDTATSLESGKKISTLIKNSYFYPYKGDHFFFIDNSKNIINTLSNI